MTRRWRGVGAAVLVALLAIPLVGMFTPTVRAAQPDLFLDDADYASGDFNFTRGMPRTLPVLLHNLGDANATQVRLAVYLVGGPSAPIANATVGAVAAMSTVLVNVTGVVVDTAQGSRLFRVVADPDNTTAEQNEANNVATIPIRVRLPAVLIVLASPPEGASLAHGRSLAVEGRVIIQGTSLVVADAAVEVTLDDALDVVQANWSARTDANGFFFVFIPETLPAGSYRIAASVEGADGPVTAEVNINVIRESMASGPSWPLVGLALASVAGVLIAFAWFARRRRPV